ncbi:Transposon Tf2-11 polyprotein [Labeo rohita]|uniref:Gypsy retrotransposon integrase-like protein 1 n=1 Tax=Labeo rohita TaxID=84645 RepID=A0ABQ8L9Y0_LABRO|nr:Transposon Tf2-11 polyprotein [Labeo rohita]
MEVYVHASITVNSILRSNNNHIHSLWSQPPSKSFVEPKSSRSWTCGVRITSYKTAFVTPTGHYEYRVMPYGLSISPSVFQTFMNEVFREFLHRFIVVYIDDIASTSSRSSTSYMNTASISSLKNFLGYIITAEGVQMDQGKVSAIQEWPQPLTVKELQRFLGFSNFYRRFIQNNSSITAPLTSLLRGKPKALIWNPAAHEAFQRLKEIFSTAPLLHHPDPKLPFTVEVDASTTGVGVVLSQAVGEPSLLHPCAFYSWKLSPAEQNYDVGNRELLAIKLALEEWRHWLEGSNHPFTIITDHKNLQYLREARRLNPRQARWALFFTRFNFTITYRPGSKNISADALSRQFSSDHPAEPEPIIPSNLIISPILWEQDDTIRQATLQEPAPPECPEGKIFVPRSQRLIILGTAHQSPGSGHPGSQRTLSLLQTRYWWPSMRRDTIRYVQSSSVCAMSTSPRQLPTGKLVPLPIPQRPWSHIGVDFVTDLPSSEGNTCILQVFRHFGLPEEIVSDWGPQFISHVWKAFFKLLGVSVNLSSGHHPQTNGQTERKIQELGRYLRAYRHKDQHSWSRFLPWAEYAQNSPPRYHRLNTLPVHTRLPASDRAVRQHKRFADVRRRPAPAYQPGDQVWLSIHDLCLRQACRKLSPRYMGPFKILRRINDVNHTGAEAEPPPPEVLDQSSIYTVHEILDSQCRGGHLEYLVDWEGYGPEERSWVPRDDILDPTLLLDFHRSHPDCPAPRGRGRPRHREPPLEEGVVSGIHHSHLHLPHLR